SYAPQIAILDPQAPAAQEGLRNGDIITSFNGEPVVTAEDLERHLTRTSRSLIRLTYLRAEEAPSPIGTALVYRSYHAQILPRKDSGLAVGMVAANTSVRSIVPGRAADKAGIRTSDRILAVNGAPISRWESLQSELLRVPERPSTLDVQSPGEEVRQVEVHLAMSALRDECGSSLDCYLGATPYRTIHLPAQVPIRGRGSFAIRAAWHQTTGKIGELWLAIRRMITLDRGIDDLSSVVGIFYIAGIVAPQGAGPFLDMMAYLSLSIGVLNFLPIPVLDGGHILLYAIESVRRRPLSQRAREIASTVGLVLVLLLLLVGVRNDIVRFWMN
ncbi:MAG: site-2 protease family protein, partial [Nannocystaceae bacterium]